MTHHAGTLLVAVVDQVGPALYFTWPSRAFGLYFVIVAVVSLVRRQRTHAGLQISTVFDIYSADEGVGGFS